MIRQSEILELVSALDVPVIIVLHTALARPSDRQRMIIERLAGTAAYVVVQTLCAKASLLDGHEIDAHRIRVIPMGHRPISARKVCTATPVDDN